ncbi:MAG: hypothetical protein J7M38_10885 [Armatimonadetes bacterium]|nr:hypothetical protein [Armatimonadota bacterium]
MATMTPRERILAALAREETDYLPCSIYFNPNLQVEGYDLTSMRDRTRLQLDLGADPMVNFGIGERRHPDVQVETRLDESTDPPILYQRFDTPAGTLRHGIKFTDDWPFGMSIPWSDHSAGPACGRACPVPGTRARRTTAPRAGRCARPSRPSGDAASSWASPTRSATTGPSRTPWP